MHKNQQYTYSPKPNDKIWDKILDSASGFFAERGYAATSIEQIIAQCGIGKDTFYRRFNSKLALFEAVTMRERHMVEMRFDEFIKEDEGSSFDKLERFLRWLLDINLEPNLIAYKRIAFTEASIIGKAVQEAPNSLTDYLIELVKELQSENVIREIDPHEVAMYCINTLVLPPVMSAMLGDEIVKLATWRDDYFHRTWPNILWGVSHTPTPH
ncbi:TetR/AcrR family transcriptional regulator [Vibrio sp. WJH972]